MLAGAFGAHALRAHLAPEALATFETGARYQLTHALALMVVALRSGTPSGAALRWSGWLLASGTVLFSGSLYALALTSQRGFGWVTPVGGLCLVLGWLALARGFAVDA